LREVLRQPEYDVTPAASRLHALVMTPLVAALQGKTHVFLAPDGALNTVPFAALVNNDGFLVEQYDFTYLTSGRDLLRFGSEPAAGGPLVVFANPEFGVADGNVSGGNTKLSKAVFQPLPGTQAEADELHALFPDAVVNTGNDASEAAVKRVARPFALHLATHGYFLPTTSLSNLTGPNGEALDLQLANERLALAENPLVRSGLAFAGATGLRGQAGEDGVLTALEASSLDLTGTQLVVLSACQTAEGEVSQGDGVYGLRRALTVAGAEALVMSLWSVDDEATSYLMRGYYRRLKEGMGRSAALRDVQRVLAASETTRHPYYWAAFIPSGNPGAIIVPSPGTPTPSPVAGADSSEGDSDPDEDDDEEVSSDSDDDWPTATPSFGASFGGVHLTLESNDGQSKFEGTPLYVSMDFSLLSAAWDEDFGNTSRGLVIYDRLGANLGWISLKGNAMATLNWDYSLLLGYRAQYLGVFLGARWGSGTVVAGDSEATNSGGYFPPAARIELPWFWDSRISALGYYGAITDKRDVMGVDVRIPLGGPEFWLQTGFSRLEGRVSQGNSAWMVPLALGFTGDD
jgi:CHAT domain-containing protein